MRGRILLMTLIASTLILTGCRLSDQQQIGVLKFVANSITGAIGDGGGGGVLIAAPAPTAGEAPAATLHEQHLKVQALQHAKSRMERAHARVQRCRVRVRSIPVRMILSVNLVAIRRILAGEATTVARKPCPRSTPAIRS